MEAIATSIGCIILGSIFFGLVIAVCIDADTLPFWALYDTMQLFTHLPLVNVAMPGQTAVFLSTLASMLRFNMLSVDRVVASSFGVDFEIHTTTESQRQAGYSSSHVLINAAVILGLASLLLCVLIIVKLADKMTIPTPIGTVPKPNGRTEVKHTTPL